jgi:hypothetical protein
MVMLRGGINQRLQALASPGFPQSAAVVIRIPNEGISGLQVWKVETTLLGGLQHVAHWRIVGRIANKDQRVTPQQIVDEPRSPAAAHISFAKVCRGKHKVGLG